MGRSGPAGSASRRTSQPRGGRRRGGAGRSDLVDELAPALDRLGAAVLLIVITVEDLHGADHSLVELKARLGAAQGAPVLVISAAR